MLIQGTAELWKEYVEHDFVKRLGRGVLEIEAFSHFIRCATNPHRTFECEYLTKRLRQDYHFLKYYARAYGCVPHERDLMKCSRKHGSLLAAKSTSFLGVESSAQAILNILQEIQTHRTLCESFCINYQELENTPEATTTTAYGSYLITVGLEGR